MLYVRGMKIFSRNCEFFIVWDVLLLSLGGIEIWKFILASWRCAWWSVLMLMIIHIWGIVMQEQLVKCKANRAQVKEEIKLQEMVMMMIHPIHRFPDSFTITLYIWWPPARLIIIMMIRGEIKNSPGGKAREKISSKKMSLLEFSLLMYFESCSFPFWLVLWVASHHDLPLFLFLTFHAPFTHSFPASPGYALWYFAAHHNMTGGVWGIFSFLMSIFALLIFSCLQQLILSFFPVEGVNPSSSPFIDINKKRWGGGRSKWSWNANSFRFHERREKREERMRKRSKTIWAPKKVLELLLPDVKNMWSSWSPALFFFSKFFSLYFRWLSTSCVLSLFPFSILFLYFQLHLSFCCLHYHFFSWIKNWIWCEFCLHLFKHILDMLQRTRGREYCSSEGDVLVSPCLSSSCCHSWC